MSDAPKDVEGASSSCSASESDTGAPTSAASSAVRRTLLRVKRRRSQDPAEALEVSSAVAASTAKKGRFAAEDGQESGKVTFTFAGTVEGQDADDGKVLRQTLDSALSRAKKAVMSKVAEGSEARREAAKEKRRAVRLEKTGKSRYHMLKHNRHIELEDDADRDVVTEDEKGKKMIKLYDVIAHEDTDGRKTPIACNGVEMIREFVEGKDLDDGDFVYDFYLADGPKVSSEGYEPSPSFDDDDFDDAFFERITSIEPLRSNLVSDFLDDCRNEIEIFDEDSDSNDEDNWRNDYPDEEEYEGYVNQANGSDDEYGEMLNDLKIGGADSDAGASSDEEKEESLVHSKAFKSDADMHGESYARFKQRVMRNLYETEDEDLEHESDINEVDEY